MTRATRRPPEPVPDPHAVDLGNPAGRGSGSGQVGPGRDARARRPPALVALCGLVLLQAGLLVGLAGAWLTGLLRGAVQLPAATVFLVLFALGVAAVLALGARGLWRGRRWARSPVMTWQVLLAVMSIGWLRSDPAPWAVGILASAVAVGVGLLLPSVVAATVERPDP